MLSTNAFEGRSISKEPFKKAIFDLSIFIRFR
jgi:hypothetical protein